MPHSIIPADGFLMTEQGPALATALDSAVDRVWMVDRSGAFVLSSITEVKPSKAEAAWRLLTEAGDVVLPSGLFALTSLGPLEGAEVQDALRKHEVIRLDVVSPEDLPPPKSLDVPTAEVYRSCLAALPRPVIQLPRGNGVADEIMPEVIQILRKAKVHYRSVADERWAALVIESVEATARAARAEWDRQAHVLTVLTAWAGHLGEYESRVRIGDCTLRRRLLASAAGARWGFSVRWLPGYYPVDSRVRIAHDHRWPARVAVQGISPLIARTLRLGTALGGDLIVSLAVLRPR